MRNRKTLLISIAVMVFMSIVGGIIWTGDRKTASTILQILPAGIDLQVREMRYVELGGSGNRWEIDADAASYLRKNNLLLLNQVRIRFEAHGGNIYRLSGESGQYNTETGDMELTGNVHVLSERGERFRTERLFFSKKEEELSTKDPVIIENQSIVVRARGMRLSLRDQSLVLNSTVRAQIN